MTFQPHTMWSGVMPVDKPAVMACLREHQPCSALFVATLTKIPLINVAAVIGSAVRAKRLRFTLEKVKGMPRPVKFYSEVIK